MLPIVILLKRIVSSLIILTLGESGDRGTLRRGGREKIHLTIIMRYKSTSSNKNNA